MSFDKVWSPANGSRKISLKPEYEEYIVPVVDVWRTAVSTHQVFKRHFIDEKISFISQT